MTQGPTGEGGWSGPESSTQLRTAHGLVRLGLGGSKATESALPNDAVMLGLRTFPEFFFALRGWSGATGPGGISCPR
jgi:hypothetical protein